MSNKFYMPLVAVLMGLALTFQASAMGDANTKVDFHAKVGDLNSSHLNGKFKIGDALQKLLGTSGKIKLSDFAGTTINVTVTVPSYTGPVTNALPPLTIDASGKVKGPVSLNLSSKGQIVQLKATALDIVKLLALDTTDGTHTATVQIKVTATKTIAGVPVTATVVDKPVTFTYTVKKGKLKGKA